MAAQTARRGNEEIVKEAGGHEEREIIFLHLEAEKKPPKNFRYFHSSNCGQSYQSEGPSSPLLTHTHSFPAVGTPRPPPRRLDSQVSEREKEGEAAV